MGAKEFKAMKSWLDFDLVKHIYFSKQIKKERRK
jgi:hypothetical protein